MNHLRVVAVNWTQSFGLKEIRPGVYEGTGGFEYDLLKVLSKAMNFSFQLVKQSNGGWGYPNEDGQWTGLTGTLQRKEADMVLQHMGLTYHRFQVIDFAFPHAIERITFASKKAGEASKDFVYLLPFQCPVWIAIIVSLVISTLFFALILHPKKRDSKVLTGLRDVIPIIELLTGNRSFKGFTKNLASKVFLVFSGLSARFLTLCFNAVFLSFLLSPIMDPQIRTLKQLAKASKNGAAKVTAVRNTYMHKMLENGTDQLSQDLGTLAQKQPEILTKAESMSIITAILKGFHLFTTTQVIEISEYEILGNSESLFYSEDTYKMHPLAIAFRKEFCCVKKFSEMIIKIHQSGIRSKIHSDHLYRLQLSSRHSNMVESQGEVRKLSVWDLRGILLLTAICLTLAIMVLIVEIVWYKFTHSKCAASNPAF